MDARRTADVRWGLREPERATGSWAGWPAGIAPPAKRSDPNPPATGRLCFGPQHQRPRADERGNLWFIPFAPPFRSTRITFGRLLPTARINHVEMSPLMKGPEGLPGQEESACRTPMGRIWFPVRKGLLNCG